MTMLPVYELKVALEGLKDEFDDPIPDVTHVQFLRDGMQTEDLIAYVDACGSDLDKIVSDVATQLRVGRVMLPRMTNLTADQVSMLRAADFMALVKILGPFLAM